MIEARLYREGKTAVQSGKRKAKRWILEPERVDAKRADPLIGWLGSNDTQSQTRLIFASEEEARAHAERMGWRVTISRPRGRAVVPKSYAANFTR